jgi:3-hydroxyacyl-[acyl-carrier-protein] dehydratase
MSMNGEPREHETMDIVQLMAVLPHRYPMLLIDRITSYERSKFAAGYKNLTMNEQFFQGHFPGFPLMPGVIMIEALAQLGGTIILGPDDFRRRMAVLTGIDKAKFRRPVVPGDRLDMEATLLRRRSGAGWVRAEAKVDGKLACTTEIMFSISAVANYDLDASILNA